MEIEFVDPSSFPKGAWTSKLNEFIMKSTRTSVGAKFNEYREGSTNWISMENDGKYWKMQYPLGARVEAKRQLSYAIFNHEQSDSRKNSKPTFTTINNTVKNEPVKLQQPTPAKARIAISPYGLSVLETEALPISEEDLIHLSPKAYEIIEKQKAEIRADIETMRQGFEVMSKSIVALTAKNEALTNQVAGFEAERTVWKNTSAEMEKIRKEKETLQFVVKQMEAQIHELTLREKAKSEQFRGLAKRLLMLAGDVESNPGPLCALHGKRCQFLQPICCSETDTRPNGIYFFKRRIAREELASLPEIPAKKIKVEISSPQKSEEQPTTVEETLPLLAVPQIIRMVRSYYASSTNDLWQTKEELLEAITQNDCFMDKTWIWNYLIDAGLLDFESFINPMYDATRPTKFYRVFNVPL